MNRSLSLVIVLPLLYFSTTHGMEIDSKRQPSLVERFERFVGLLSPEPDNTDIADSEAKSSLDTKTAIAKLVGKSSISSMQRSRAAQCLKETSETETLDPIHQQLLILLGAYSKKSGEHYKSFKAVYDSSKTLEDSVKPTCKETLATLNACIVTEEKKLEGINTELEGAFLIVSSIIGQRRACEEVLQTYKNELKGTDQQLSYATKLQDIEEKDAKRITSRLETEIANCEQDVDTLQANRKELFENIQTTPRTLEEQTGKMLHTAVAEYDEDIKGTQKCIEIYQEQLAEMESKLLRIKEPSSLSVSTGVNSRWKSREIEPPSEEN